MQKITKQPLFGKANLVETPLGDIGYRHPDTNSTSIPAISGGKATLDKSIIYSDVPVHIFSNGSEAEAWLCGNCYECKKRKEDIVEPIDLRTGGCALELRIALSAIGDGKIPFKTAKRIGYKRLHIQDNGIFVSLGHCKEFEEK